MQLRSIQSASTFDSIANLYHQRAHKLRNPPKPEARSISPNRKPYVTIRPINLGYACRYHDTDVVKWSRLDDAAAKAAQTTPGDYVTVTGWSSLSTETFADALTPNNVRFLLHYDAGFFARVGPALYTSGSDARDDEARVYEFDNTIAFKVENGVARPVDYTTTKVIDAHSPLLRAALVKTKYFDFLTYARARMHIGCPVPIKCDKAHLNKSDLVCLLDAPDRWDDILFSRRFMGVAPLSPIAHVEHVTETMRAAVYREYKAICVRSVEWLPYSQFQSQLRLRNKYAYAIY